MSNENAMKTVWEKIDKHSEAIEDINKEISGISKQMGVLEVRFNESNKTQTEGHARIETKLDGLVNSVSKLNQAKTISEAKAEAKAEHQEERKEFLKLCKWFAGVLFALIASGALTVQFASDKINQTTFPTPPPSVHLSE
jgi:septal ring factor EnvC (AmiA/AmiB activator)